VDDEAIWRADRFDAWDDGRHIRGEFSSGPWTRCMAHHDAWFGHVDGGGEVHRYRLVPPPLVPGRRAARAHTSPRRAAARAEIGVNVEG
jgi:hypothetical protein